MVSTGPSWIEDVATEHQIQTWIRPTVDGDIHECYAITEEGAGSDVDGIEATAGHEDDDYVLNGVKWHVTSANLAAYVFFQAKLVEGPNAGRHACSSSTWAHLVWSAFGSPSIPTPMATTTGR